MEKIKRTFGFIFNHPLAKRHPVKAFYRFLLWQLQSSISSSKFIIKPFVAHLKFYARKGLAGATGNIYTGLHEFNDMGFLLHFLQPDDVFFDIGANVGSYTLLASGICQTTSVAVEPIKSTFEILSKNIQLNNLSNNVILVNSGAGAIVGELRFSANEDTTNHVIAVGEQGEGAISVTAITVDSLLEKGSPALIKIDVEGFETEVLKGMSYTLDNTALKAIIIELNGSGLRYGFNEDAIHDMLLSKGFTSFSYNPFTRLLNETPPFSSGNTIYCRDLSIINERLKNAKKIKLWGELI